MRSQDSIRRCSFSGSAKNGEDRTKMLLRTSCRSLGCVFPTSAWALLHLRKLIRHSGYIYRLILTIALFVFVGLAVQAQDLTLHLTVVATQTPEVKVEGSSIKGTSRWYFK